MIAKIESYRVVRNPRVVTWVGTKVERDEGKRLCIEKQKDIWRFDGGQRQRVKRLNEFIRLKTRQ